MFEQMQPVIQNFVVTVVAGILGVLASFLIACAKKGFEWIAAKVSKVKDDTARDAINNALKDLNALVTATVTSLQQSLGDDIKKSIAEGDGRYTRDDLLALTDTAMATIKSQLSDSAKQALSTVYADLNSFIADLIQSKVRELKAGTNLIKP